MPSAARRPHLAWLPLGLALLCLAFIGQPSVAGAQTSDTALALTEAIHATAAAEMASTPPDGDLHIRVLRTQGDRWAFGTVVQPAPRREGAQPRDWLFLASREYGTWEVALDGQTAFTVLAQRSPLTTGAEKAAFPGLERRPATRVDGDYRTGMQLPWAVGQSWAVLGGPHAFDAGTGPWSSLDLAGGDQRVLAARDGLAYTMCVGLVRIVHSDGYASRYYHLWNHIQADGTPVSTGTYLGNTGTETGCGGAASARHVHFSLMHTGAFVAIAGHIVGKWVFQNGAAQYQGSALHGSTRVAVGGQVTNHGPLARTQGIVDADGDALVNRRTGPGTSHALAGTVADGATVTVQCSATGTTHTGRWGTSSLWNRLSDGTWISDAYLYTGVDGPVNGTC